MDISQVQRGSRGEHARRMRAIAQTRPRSVSGSRDVQSRADPRIMRSSDFWILEK